MSQHFDKWHTAHVILLLVSPHFMASRYCYGTEMKQAIKRHHGGKACVIPIILRPVIWEDAPFSKLQVLPTNGIPVTRWQDRDEALWDVAKGIREVVKDMLSSLKTEEERLQERQRQANKMLEEYKRSLHTLLAYEHAINLGSKDPIVFALRPESLECEGLVAALTRQVAVLRARYKLTVEPSLDEEPDLSLEKKQALYRIAQEALHNIVKHARASSVTLRLTKQEEEIILEVRDNGKGFDPSRPFPGHLGIRSMQERVTKMGGTLGIESLPGQGTCVRVRVPLAQVSSEQPGVRNKPALVLQE